jgi:hypothetical protein
MQVNTSIPLRPACVGSALITRTMRLIISTFPKLVQRHIGQALRAAQRGEEYSRGEGPEKDSAAVP